MNKTTVSTIRNMIQEYKERVMRDAIHYCQRADASLELLPLPFSLPGDAKIEYVLDRIWITIPRSEKAMRQLQKQLDKAEIEYKKSDYSSSDGSVNYHLMNQGRTFLHIEFSATMDGAQCVRTLVGTEKVEIERNIYEVTCPEGADENIWK